MKKRMRLTRDQTARERSRIEAFCLYKLKPAPGVRIHTLDLFMAYQSWLEGLGLSRTPLSVDGFGRLLSNIYERRHIFISGKVARGLEGYSF